MARRVHIGISLLLLVTAYSAVAVEVNVVGLFAGKAMLEINKAPARIVNVGQTVQGIKLIEANSDGALVEINGKRERLKMGQSVASGGPSSDKPRVVLTADTNGHFVTTGQMNGASTLFLVDTGATTVAMGSSEAKRLGIPYLKGRRIISSTANGLVPSYLITLDTVTLGGVTLNQVEASVIEGQGMEVTLLGMSFLKRLEMRREGSSLTLTKNY